MGKDNLRNDLTVFDFEKKIRTIMIDGEPWFVAKDVAEALGYTWVGAKTIAHIPDIWKGVQSVGTPGGTQRLSILSEQGLYFFLNRSDKPEAIPIQMWVAGEVLPSIRKTGTYGQPAIDVKNKPVTLLPIDKEFWAAIRMATGLR